MLHVDFTHDCFETSELLLHFCLQIHQALIINFFFLTLFTSIFCHVKRMIVMHLLDFLFIIVHNFIGCPFDHQLVLRIFGFLINFISCEFSNFPCILFSEHFLFISSVLSFLLYCGFQSRDIWLDLVSLHLLNQDLVVWNHARHIQKFLLRILIANLEDAKWAIIWSTIQRLIIIWQSKPLYTQWMCLNLKNFFRKISSNHLDWTWSVFFFNTNEERFATLHHTDLRNIDRLFELLL